MKKIAQHASIIACSFFVINCQAMIQKSAGVSSEQTRINSINSEKTSKQYQVFMQKIKNQVKQTLNTQLTKTNDKEKKEKIKSLQEKMDQIIQSMGVLKFVVSFGGLLNYARKYKKIWNNSEQLKTLLQTLYKQEININNLMSRFMHVYDHDAFAGDLDRYKADNYLRYATAGTYLIRISQKNSPGGFTFSTKGTLSLHHRANFFFSGNGNEIVYDKKKFKNLIDVIKNFNFGCTLEKTVTIYGITLGSFWKTSNKY